MKNFVQRRLRERKANRPKETGVFLLNITSMTDMFTILLVFLLQTYSVHESPFEPEKNLQLPMSNAEVTPTKTAGISVSLHELKFAGQLVTELEDGHFSIQDTQAKMGNENLIPKLLQMLRDSAKTPGPLTIQADAALSYATLQKVMNTAQMAGYADIKLATVVEE